MMRSPIRYGRGTLTVCRRGHSAAILLVALSRPDVQNALNDDCYLDLIQLLREVTSDDSLVAIVLTGMGSTFCSGADIHEVQDIITSPTSVTDCDDDGAAGAASAAAATNRGRQTFLRPSGQFMQHWLDFPKILVAAVQGPAIGIGVTLLLHCDLVHCSKRATFWIPFTRLALVPELCSSVTLVETMGLSKANELLLLGKSIDAETALQWNLVSRIHDDHNNNNNNNTDHVTAIQDPFHPASLANAMCNELDVRLLQLPLGHRTAQYFVSLIRRNPQRRARMILTWKDELERLDERFDTGQVKIAAQQLQIGKRRHQQQQQQQRDQQQQSNWKGEDQVESTTPQSRL